ncbi:MAG: RNA-binding S4 domain-containing protein [Alphaproteobacteria bacterium]|nr:RNA-binding S4 domain-containing protein [Alphaproteobacteria bacterium]
MQRIDKYLWFTRCYKSRTLAATLVTQGRVRINGARCEKPSTLVKIGDVLTLSAGAHVRIIRVVGVGVRRGPASEASLLYLDLTPPAPAKDSMAALTDSSGKGSGRPTKKERRDIKAFTRDDGRDD